MPTDIAAVLSISGTDLEANCKSTAINMWAKYKPVAKNKIDTTDELNSNRDGWAANSTWWKGNTYTCGITPYITTNIDNIISHTNGTLNGWSYTKPSGGSNSPYRLLDFLGYNHNAPALMSNFRCSETVRVGDLFSATAYLAPQVSGADYLTLPDISGNTGNLYFGVAFVRSGQSTVQAYGTNSNAFTGTFDYTMNLSTGTYTVYPFLAESPQTIGGTIVANRFYSCPFCSPVTISVVNAVSYTSKAEWAMSKTRVVVTIHNYDTSRTLSGSLRMRFPNHAWNSADTADEPSKSFSVAANSESTFTFTSGFDNTKSYVVYVVPTAGATTDIQTCPVV